MKNMLIRFAGIVLLATLASVDSAQAVTTYTNSVLKGCYSFLGTSVDAGAVRRATVGTLCYDGSVDLVPGPTNSGYVVNNNGVTTPVTLTYPAGNYQLYNSPGDGMGQLIVSTISGVCYGSDEFSIDSATSGLAGGYRFIKIKPCANRKQEGGTAIYQGPGGTAYTNSVLNGCYSFLQTSVDTVPRQNGVGTLCFDGAGNIVMNTSPSASGSVQLTNGTILFNNPFTGTYSVTNSPGDGMGTFTLSGSCPFTTSFSINKVSGGQALGLQWETVSCSGVNVMGGTAQYQGP